MAIAKKITVLSTNISVLLDKNNNDYICLTDMVKAKENDTRAADIIKNWIRNRSTLEFLGTWETLYNPNFKVVEFDHFKKEAGLPTFTLSVREWVEKTNAIGIISKPGRYGGTYAHRDIAFEFGSAISPVFKLYLIKEYQRLIEQEKGTLSLTWDVKRLLSKTNYILHTDAIKHVIIPKLSPSSIKNKLVYADEADMLNLVVFGCFAKDWENANPKLAGKKLNMRDTATINQLVVLSNMESLNSTLIKQGVHQQTRFTILNNIAKEQIKVLDESLTEHKFRRLTADNQSLPEE
uniref:KilA-N domain-containing protein n=1 Tax=Prevotella sp. GTC17259 TaxID=3236795 RepID=A0AB33J9Z1_9BACT